MLLLVTILTLTISLAGLVVYFQNKRKQRLKDLYPLQVKVLSELLNEIRTHKIFLYRMQNARPEEIGAITMTEAANNLEGTEELAKEIYDDHKLLFSEGVDPFPGLSKYIGNGILPKNIRTELKDFHSTRFERARIGNSPCFVLAPVGHPLQGEVLVQGNADAFDSWLTFKEHVHNIEYLVQQWVVENTPQEFGIKQAVKAVEAV